MNLFVACLQLSARPGEIEANLDRLEGAVGGLPGECQLAVAPELFTTGYDLELLGETGHELAERVDGRTIDRLGRLVEVTDLTLAVGFLETDGSELFDSVAVVSPAEDPVVYRKTHLYPAEQNLFGSGEKLVWAERAGASLGLMICFEHAFPEIATSLALAGSEILVIPSAVPVGYEHVLSLRTRARAQDNQVFAIGCNMADPFCGRSIIADPRGETVAGSTQAGEEILLATLDLDAVANERAREPSLGMRRPELYD